MFIQGSGIFFKIFQILQNFLCPKRLGEQTAFYVYTNSTAKYAVVMLKWGPLKISANTTIEYRTLQKCRTAIAEK